MGFNLAFKGLNNSEKIIQLWPADSYG